MRLTLLKLAALLASLIAGCMSPINADIVDDGRDVIVEPVPIDESVAGNVVSVSMTSEQFANLATWLGNKNSLVIEHAVHVEQESVTLDAKAGTRLSYTMSDDSGTITFTQPYPTIKAGIAKLIGGVALRDIVLKSDGSGSAGTASFGRYKFRWDEESGSAAVPIELPEVWYWSHDGCPPCARFEADYAANKASAGFRPVKQTNERPTWMPNSDPQFWWHVSGKVPTQADVANTRHQNGYPGWKDLSAKFDHSRAPKKFSRSVDHGQAGRGARPDPDNTRAVARYHAGHACPSCGRMEYAIADNSGPNHTHRCGACSTTWWHAASVSGSARESRSTRLAFDRSEMPMRSSRKSTSR